MPYEFGSINIEKNLTDSQILTKDYRLKDAGFIASGSEMAFKHFLNDGKLRVDGKLVIGCLENNGTLKVEGTVETEPIFT